MNNQSSSIWTKPWKGLRGIMFCALITSIAAALFAAAATALAYILTPDNVRIWAGVNDVSYGQTPGVVPALIALQVMGLFIALSVPALVLYRAVKWLVRRAATGSPRAITATMAVHPEP